MYVPSIKDYKYYFMFMGVCSIIALILNIPVSIFENKVFGKLTRRNGRIWSKIKRAVSVVLSLSCFFLLCGIILSYNIPEFWRTCQGFINRAPKYMEDLTTTLREWVIILKMPIDPESINITWDIVAEWVASYPS